MLRRCPPPDRAGFKKAGFKPADAATLAAWVNVTNTILNLDECIVRE